MKRQTVDSSMAQDWSLDGQVYYVDAQAYMIKPVWVSGELKLLKSVHIGKREDIIKEHPIK